MVVLSPTAWSQPATVGQWGTTQLFPYVTVHGGLLPTGQVLFWDYSGNARLWDPATTAITTPAQPGRNTFCSGSVFLADGKLFVAGGHIQNNVGLPNASYYDPVANTWTSVPNMNAGRWYPSATTLANGDLLIASGDDNLANNDLPQVFQAANNTWRNLTSARMALSLFPRTFLAPNGRVFFATSVSRYLDTAGSGGWSTVGNTVFPGRDNYGTACMDQNGRVFWFGGGDPPTATAERIDLTAATPQWSSIAAMPQVRRQNNVTLLPDGKMLVTGGSASGGFNTEDGPKAALLYDPVANSWSTLATESDYRGYHSTAILLPDGRILSSGGDNHANGQVFSPPYLFNGTRPTISSAPANISYGTVFFVGTPDGATITKATLTRLSMVTHAQNWNQRILNLTFSQTTGGLNLTAPNSVNLCPPGHYLLWLLNGSGVPSVAKVVRIANFGSPPPVPTGLSATPGIGKVTLNWTAAPTATGYNLKRAATSGGPYTTLAANLAATAYVDNAVTAATTYYYVVSGLNPQGESANSSQVSAVPLAGGGGTGLNGDYYNNSDFTAFALSRTDATVNFDWGSGSPDPSIAADTFSVRWTGQVQPAFSETYTFYTTSDDGVRLWVNGVPLLDNWTDHSPTENSGTISLSAGVKYSLQMDFYENGGGAVASLSWSSPSQLKEIIPQAQLFPPFPVPPAPTGLAAAGRNARVDLTWNPSSGATSYNVKRATVSGGPYTTIASGLSTTSHNDTTALNGTTYYYVVSAVGSGGESPNSTQASATPAAPNSPPLINSLTASPNPAPISTLVTLTLAATDPNGDALSYSFDFGDGTAATPFTAANNATHTYNAAGRYTVVARVRDGVNPEVAGSRIQIVHQPLTAGKPAASAQIIFDASRQKVWNVNPDSDTVTRIDATALTKEFEIGVGLEPRSLALRPDQSEIWVACEGSDQLSVLNAANGAVLQTLATPRGSQPMGLVFSPDGTAAYVSYMGNGRVAKWNPATRTEVATLDVGPHPRALALSADSSRLFVGRFISPANPFTPSAEVGEVREISTATFTLTRLLTLAHDLTPDTEASGRGTPNYLVQMSISPDGRDLWVPSKKDNVDRGQFRDGFALGHDSTVRSLVSVLDLVNNTEDSAARRDVDDHELPHGVTFSPVGDLAFVAYQGNNEVKVFSAYDSSTVATISLGTQRAPQDLVLNSTGTRLFVMNFMTRSVSAFDVAGLVGGTDSTATPLAVVNTVATEKLSAQVLQGKRIFYNAADPRMSRQGYISCAACHLDGGQDGRIMDFTDRGEGLRNTIKLQGRRGTTQGNVHWTANFDEIQDFELDIRNAFGGTGFISGTPNNSLGAPNAGRSADLDALAAYVASLAGFGKSPYRNANGTLTSDALAGKQLFQQLNCASCHSGAQFTDSTSGPTSFTLHDVGTQKPSSGKRLNGALTGLDTPTLRGLWNTVPYLHDGSAATLLDVITTQNPTGLHGQTSSLTPAQQAQLIAYLQQIDDDEPSAIPVPPSGLTALAGSSQVTLNWTAAPGATSYTIKRATTAGGPYTIVASGVTSTSYVNGGLANGTTYYFVVTAVNAGGEGLPSNVASATPAVVTTTVTFTSISGEDGHVRESNETSGTGNTVSTTGGGAAGLRLGDDNQDRQYRAFVSFDTSAIPDGAVILSATVKLKRGSIDGTNPFTTHGACYLDIKSGSGFGGSPALAAADFQAAADATQVATMSNPLNNGDWSTGTINATGRAFVNKTGKTQFRIYFALDDNDDRDPDYLGFYAADNSTAANRPVLEITYQQ